MKEFIVLYKLLEQTTFSTVKKS